MKDWLWLTGAEEFKHHQSTTTHNFPNKHVTVIICSTTACVSTKQGYEVLEVWQMMVGL